MKTPLVGRELVSIQVANQINVLETHEPKRRERVKQHLRWLFTSILRGKSGVRWQWWSQT